MSLNAESLKAAESGDLEGLIRCLQSGANVDFQDSDYGWSALFYAVYAGQQPIVEFLCCEARADPNLIDHNGKMALHTACKNGNLESAKFLIERGADVNFMATEPADSWPPLTYAAHHCWLELVEYLLSVGADPGIQSIHGLVAAELTSDPLIRERLLAASSSGGAGAAQGSSAADAGRAADEEGAPEVFISCDQADLELAQRLKGDIEKAGFSTFLSCPDLDQSEDAFSKFVRPLQGAQVVLALLSNRYADDPPCRKQVNFADGAKKLLITLLTREGTLFPPAGPMGPTMAGKLYQDFTLRYLPYEASLSQLIPKIDSVIRAVSLKEQARVPRAKSGAPAKLITAVEQADLSGIREYINQGFDLNKGDAQYKWTPLMWACYHGNDDVVQLLCSEGKCDPTYMDAAGKQAIHIAAKNGNLKCCQFLVDRGSDVNSKPPLPADAWTPLMYAANQGHADVIDFLLRRGADPSRKDIVGKTAVDYASSEAAISVLKSKIPTREARRTDVFLSYNWAHQEVVKKVKETLEKEGLTVWMDINQMGAGDSLFEEIDAGMRNATAVVSFVTLPYTKSLNCNKEIRLCSGLKKPMIVVKLDPALSWPPEGPMAPLLADKMPLDSSDFGPFLNTLLGRLKTLCSQAPVAPVVRRGIVDSDLFEAATNGNLEKTRAAVASGSDPNARDEQWTWTPLMWAVYGNHSSVVEFLCSEGRCDVTTLDKHGKQALHVACKNGHLDIVKFLIERGADVNYMAREPKDTWNPLMYAVKYGFLDIIKFLIQCGADVTAVNGIGTTAQSLAVGKPAILALLSPNPSIEIPLKVEANVFLSAYGAQLPLAKRIKAELESHDISVWMDEGQFGKDDVHIAAVDHGMRSCQVVIALVSDSYSSKVIHQKEINLSDGLKKRTISFLATAGATFPPMGLLGPILAPHPVFDLSTDFDSNFQAALPTLQGFIHNPVW